MLSGLLPAGLLRRILSRDSFLYLFITGTAGKDTPGAENIFRGAADVPPMNAAVARL
jgi:hypothetical protein